MVMSNIRLKLYLILLNGLIVKIHWFLQYATRVRNSRRKEQKKKNDKLGKGKRKKEKSAKNLGNIQLEAEGWISYFRTSSAQKIRQAIESEKFQKLAPKAQEEILNQAKKFLSQKDE